ncbi:MAG: A alpha-helical domain with a conserved ER moti [Rhizobiales bacterium 65-9]|nr:alpha-E domain-containing protein [Hyphomicrobiales bacterium]OJY33833.1 MAG: A alpha-helical domain with a conserved ER moti [Rhizobiales bacterium 65-9]
MLSRTADSLFWMSRYMERAENLARIIDAAHRLSALPASYGGTHNEWESALLAAGCADSFHRIYKDATEMTVRDFICFSEENQASIRKCIDIARMNARAVRTAITTEMWDAINGAWLDMKNYDAGRMDREELSRFLEWVKNVSLVVDGSAHRSMLRRDEFFFTRLGLYVERADNILRLLDVKYHVLLPATERVGGTLDYFQWSSLLRSVSALTAYHWVYRESVKPWLVADLLTLNREMPRSLYCCYENLVEFLDQLARQYGRIGPSQHMARSALARLENTNIETIFQNGLHEFISQFIIDNNKLASAIQEQYLV